MSDQSRYTRYLHHRQLRKKRTIPIYGEKEDTGKYFKCWNCGFICNVGRDSLGDGDGRAYLDSPEIAGDSFGSQDPLSVELILDDLFTILQNDANGNPITSYRYNQYPAGSGGCPLCHSQNYK